MEVSLLKHKKQELKETFSTNLSLRVHRALSWLERSEQCSTEDIVSQFIFLWIAFNSAYACNGRHINALKLNPIPISLQSWWT